MLLYGFSKFCCACAANEQLNIPNTYVHTACTLYGSVLVFLCPYWRNKDVPLCHLLGFPLFSLTCSEQRIPFNFFRTIFYEFYLIRSNVVYEGKGDNQFEWGQKRIKINILNIFSVNFLMQYWLVLLGFNTPTLNNVSSMPLLQCSVLDRITCLSIYFIFFGSHVKLPFWY